MPEMDHIATLKLSKQVTLQGPRNEVDEFAAKLEQARKATISTGNTAALWLSHRAWSDAAFGTARGPVGALKHLAKEAMEAAENPTDLAEFADCLFLLWDGVHRAGFTMDQVVAAGFEKLKVLHTRTYDRNTPEDQPAEHDRAKD